jgi:O-antigen/teichoic acid export membrane protein
VTGQSFRSNVYRLFRYNALTFAIRLLTSIVIARMLGPAIMGAWLLLALLPTYAEGFARLKADAAAIYVLSKGDWELGEVSLAVVVIALVTSLPVVAGLLMLESQILDWLFGAAAVEVIWYRLIVLSIPLHFVALAYSYLILQLEDVRAYNLQNFLRTVLPSIVAAGLVLATPMRIGALTCTLVGGAVAGLAYGAVVIHRRARPRFARQRGLYSSLLSFGGRLYVAGAVEHLNQYLSSLLVGLHLRPVDVTFLRLGQDRLQVLDQVTTSMNTLLFPRIAREADRDVQVDVLSQSMRLLILVLILAGAVGAIFTPAIVWALYGAEYMPMVWSIWLLLPGVLLLGVTSPVSQYLMGSGRPDWIWKLGLVPLVLQVGLLTVAIEMWGFRGAAAAVSLSFIAHAAARLILLRAVTGRTARSFMVPGRGDWSLLVTFLQERIKLGLRAGHA